MLFQGLTIRVLMVAMLGPLVAVSDNLPICAPPAPLCPMFKRSVCEWSASDEPVWACKGYFEAANPRRSKIDGGRNLVNDVEVDSTTDEDVTLGTYEYHIPLGRQLISHHEPEMKIGTYTYPVPNEKRIVEEEPNTVLHKGTYTYPVPSRKVTVDGVSDTILQPGTQTYQVPNKKRSAEGESDTIQRTGTYIYTMPSRTVTVEGGSDTILHTGTHIYQVPSKKRSAEEETDTILHTGMYAYPVPSKKKIAEGEDDIIWSAETQPLPVAPRKIAVGEYKIINQTEKLYTSPMAPQIVVDKESDPIVITETYTLPVARQIIREVESDAKVLIGTNTYGVPSNQKSSISKKAVDHEAEITHTLSHQKVSGGESDSIQHSGLYTLPLVPQNVIPTVVLSEANEQAGMNTHGVSSLPIQVDSKPQVINNPLVSMVYSESVPEVEYGIVEYGIPSEKRSSLLKSASESDVKMGYRAASVNSSGTVQIPHDFDGMHTHQYPSMQKTLESDSTASFRAPVLLVPVGSKRDESDQINVGTMKYQVPFKKMNSASKEVSGSDENEGLNAISLPVQVDSVVAQGKPESEVWYGTLDYIVPSEEKGLSSKSESESRGRSETYNLLSGRRNEDYRSPDPEFDIIDINTYGIPSKSKVPSGPNASSNEVNNLRLGTLMYSKPSSNNKAEAGSTNMGGSSEVQENQRADSSAINPILSGKESANDFALHVNGGIHELPILSARNDDTPNALPVVEVDDIEAIDGSRKNMATADVSESASKRLGSLQSDDMGSMSGSRSVSLNQRTIESGEIVGASSSTGDSQAGINEERTMVNDGRASGLTGQPLQHYMNAGHYQQYPTASASGPGSAHQTLNVGGGYGASYGYGYPLYGYGGFRLPGQGAAGQLAGLASGVYHPLPQPWAPLLGPGLGGYRNPFLVGQDAPIPVDPILHGRLPNSLVPLALPYYGARSLNSLPNGYGARSQNPVSDDHGISNSLARTSSAYYPPSTQSAGVGREFQYDEICAFCKNLLSLMRQLLSAPSTDVCVKIEPLIQELFKDVFEVWGKRLTNNAS